MDNKMPRTARDNRFVNDEDRRQNTDINIPNNIYLIILVKSYSFQRYYLVRFFVFCFENGPISTYESFMTMK